MKKVVIIVYILAVLVSLVVGLSAGSYSSMISSDVYGPTVSADEMGRVHYYKGWFKVHFLCETEAHYSDSVETIRTTYYGANILFVVVLYVVLLGLPFVAMKFLANSCNKRMV